MSVSNSEYAKLVQRCFELEIALGKAVHCAEPYTAKVVDGVSIAVYPTWVVEARKLLDSK